MKFEKKFPAKLLLPMVSAMLVLTVSQTFAHAILVGSDPAKDTTVAAPKVITLHFSEALEMKVSGFKLTDGEGKLVEVNTMAAPDARSLSAAPAKPLRPGLYKISWTSMGDDSHKLTGTLSFSVK